MSKLSKYLEDIEINRMDPIKVINSHMDPDYTMAQYVLGELHNMYDIDSIKQDLTKTLHKVPSGLLKAAEQVIFSTIQVFSDQWTFFPRGVPVPDLMDRLFEIEITGPNQYDHEVVIVKSDYDIAKIKHPPYWEITEIDMAKYKDITRKRKEYLKSRRPRRRYW